MSTSIYSIGEWTAATDYVANDIVANGTYYYYCTIAHTSSASLNYEIDRGLWMGYALDSLGTSYPYFGWKTSYGFTTTFEPKIKIMKYGDGYEQRMADGINYNLLQFDVGFDNRDIHEYTAIMHFLNQRNGKSLFLFVPPAPFNTKKKFLCRSWTGVPEALNNFSIKAKFEEVTC